MPGLINVDFADVKTVMQNAGTALMGIGIGTGDDRAVVAAKAAITSPLLDISIDGATGILFNIIGGEDMSMSEVDEAAKIIIEEASPDANIIFGTTIDESMSEQIKITVIATGFDTEDIRSKLGMRPERSEYQRDSFEASKPIGVKAGAEDDEDMEEVDIDDEREDEDETKKDSWGKPSLGEDPESKYDIPAFLRGK
jgi:cell division protein FtsZ